jgi:subtilisin-like proprotein convertase family protein
VFEAPRHGASIRGLGHLASTVGSTRYYGHALTQLLASARLAAARRFAGAASDKESFMKQVSSRRVSVALATTVAAAALALPSVAPAASKTFTNASPVTIPNAGNASPYPSTIAVSGFAGPVQDVNVRLNGLQHPSDWDLTLLLVGPAGQRTILMSATGSATGPPAPNETFTLDDEAATSLTTAPCSAQAVTPGSYKPTRATCGDANPEAFTPPAPAGPYPVSLSVFDGKPANGTWKLFIIDEATSDGGVLSGGWSVIITGPTDRTPPQTTITKRPANTTTKQTATFGFSSSEPGSTFECRLDFNLGFSRCRSPLTVRRMYPGDHSFAVRARDRSGNVDATPAKANWKVARVAR